MSEHAKKLWEGLIKWHPLTEIPATYKVSASSKPDPTVAKPTDKSDIVQPMHPSLDGISPVLIKLIWDILVYLFSSVSVRIKRLSISARAFEDSKLYGLEKGFFIESFAGRTLYLIPTRKAFEAFNMPCPYKRDISLEHSYYVLWTNFMLDKDPRFKSVQTEVKRGVSGSTSDVITVAHDGVRRAWEVTLSTTNVLANASKYVGTDFVQVIFLCRDYKLREAVKACCREGGLDPELLAKLDYMQFSSLLRRQRKLSLY